MGKLYTVKEAADKLSVAEGTLRNWLYQGKIKGVKVNRATRIREEDMLALIKPLEINEKGE